MESLFNGIYKGKTILITGHNGFKGSWLSFWLYKMGAKLHGIALNNYENSNHFQYLKSSIIIEEHDLDIRNYSSIYDTVKKINPDIIFHLAAQTLVRESYENPKYTFETNFLGTLNIFEAVRKSDIATCIINITTDKVYKNIEKKTAFKESDILGGHDPYSSSKVCSEILTVSYKKSFFNQEKVLLSTSRAGNVIGGGDWAKDRLIPDIVRSLINNSTLNIRNPKAVRPWQHVLDCVSGYLIQGTQLLSGNKSVASNWNFGPEENGCISVKNILELYNKYHKIGGIIYYKETIKKHESSFLMLDCSKAKEKLNWRPVWNLEKTIEVTANWYSDYLNKRLVNTESDLMKYISDAKKQKVVWA